MVRLTRLGELMAQRRDTVFLDDLSTYRRCRVQVHAQGIVLRDTVKGVEVRTKKQQRVHTGDLLVAEIDAKMGGYGVVPEPLDGAVVSSHYFVFEIDRSLLCPPFLECYTRTRSFHDQVRAQGSTNYAAIRPSQVLTYTIPLPSLAEQVTTVALLNNISAIQRRVMLLRTGASTDAEALRGSLVSEVFAARSHDVPMADIADVRGGIQKTPARAPGAHPVRYLTVAHVQRGHISTSDPRFFDVPPSELERRQLQDGDVLIIEGNGSADQIGRAALYRGELDPCVHQNHVIRVRPDRALISPEYLTTYLNGPAGQAAVQEQSRTTSGLRSLSVGRIKDIRVPLMPLESQASALQKLDHLEATLHALEARQAEALLLARALPASSFRTTFDGLLARTNTNELLASARGF